MPNTGYRLSFEKLKSKKQKIAVIMSNVISEQDLHKLNTQEFAPHFYTFKKLKFLFFKRSQR